MPKIGEEKKLNTKMGLLKFRCIASRSSNDRAEALKKRLTRIGTIQIQLTRVSSRAVGVPPTYWVWARPAKQLTWEKLDKAIERLL